VLSKDSTRTQLCDRLAEIGDQDPLRA
jgi:hypothetical protein